MTGSILDQIVARKRRELAAQMEAVPLEKLEPEFGETPALLSTALESPSVNIIAEIKYRSPSRGEFPCRVAPAELAQIYADNGAAAISVLTDKTYFGGELDNLGKVRRQLPELPTLRKDFIIHRYQVAEARAQGASAYLLIAACLSSSELSNLIAFGGEAGLEPLVEVHDPFELEKAVQNGARIIGVNNRDLSTFEVDIRVSFDIARRLEGDGGYLLVSESGLSERSQILELRDAGFSGFLIGTRLMEAADPGEELRALLGRKAS